MNWEKELLWAMNRWSKANKVESDDNWGSLISWVKKLLRSQRQDLLKELRGEVEGMKLPTSTRNYITKAEPINKKLQDVIKLLEKYE